MSEVHGAIGSYVVNALDPAEKDEFEAHLETCDTCRREVVEFSETAAQLGSLVETPPPPALRASVLSAIREVRPLPPEVSETGIEWDSAPPLTESTPAPVGDELAVRRVRRTSRLLSLAVAAAMVVALALGGWAVNLNQQRQAQAADAVLLTRVLTAPDAKIYTKTMSNGAPVSFVVSKGLDRAVFFGRDLPSPGEKKTYQLWTVQANKEVEPDKTFEGGATRQTLLSGSVKNAAGFAVTIEPAGGSAIPTQVPITRVQF